MLKSRRHDDRLLSKCLPLHPPMCVYRIRRENATLAKDRRNLPRIVNSSELLTRKFEERLKFFWSRKVSRYKSRYTILVLNDKFLSTFGRLKDYISMNRIVAVLIPSRSWTILLEISVLIFDKITLYFLTSRLQILSKFTWYWLNTFYNGNMNS